MPVKIHEDVFLEGMISEKEALDVSKLQREFLTSYIEAKDKMSVDEWLVQELKKQLPEYPKKEIKEMSMDIIRSIQYTEEKKTSQQQAIEDGKSKESWLASVLMQHTSHMSTQESAKYLQGLDAVLKNANEAMYDTITTKAGLPNQNMNLDGFIAEQHHVNTYNLKAQAVGGELHAEVLKPKPGETYAKNSVDIAIKDTNGKIVCRYQAKYGATAEETIRMIKEGNYRGQQLLVPEEQLDAVQKAFPDRKVSATIGEGEITSKPLSKQQAKELQKEAQSGHFLDANWNEYVAKDVALGIGKQAGYACLQGAVIGAGMHIATKVLSGEEVNGEEVIETAIVSGTDFGVKTAVAGALKVASEKEILTIIPKGTKGSTFANIAFVAIENVKVMGKVASGELSVKEGVDAMQQTTGACVAGIATSAKGAEIGGVIGSVFGPVGIAVGGFVGGTVGYMAGSKVGQAVVKGAQKVRDTAKEFIRSGVETVKSGVTSFVSGLAGIFGL